MVLHTNTPHTMRNSGEVKSAAPEQEDTVTPHLVGLVNHVARSEEYRTLRSGNIPHTEAFSGAITDILNSPDNGFNGFDTALLTVTAQLGTYIEANSEIKALEEERKTRTLSEDETERAKELKREHLIPFNHSLKSLINEGPNTSLNDLAAALTRTHTAVFAPHNSLHPGSIKYIEDTPKPSAVLYRFEGIINSMRHEVAVETMFTAAGIEYDYEISVEEDAHGIDIIAYIDGNREPLDIKSSAAAEAHSKERNPFARSVATHLGNKHFTGMRGTATNALCIPFSVAQNRAPLFVSNVREVVAAAREHEASLAPKQADKSQPEQ